MKHLHKENDSDSTFKFLKQFENEPLIQEMYEWYYKLKDELSPSDSIKEIKEIVEALLDRLNSEFDITLIGHPNKIIKTPSPQSKYYRFENKYFSELKSSRVLKCGLKMGDKVISPCLLYQIEKQ